jgi:hypothetical protein
MNTASEIPHRAGKKLRARLLVHGAGILLMAAVFWVLVGAAEARRTRLGKADSAIQKYLGLKGVDFGDPVDRALFRESLDAFFPGRAQRNDSLLAAIDDLRQRQFTDPAYKSGNDQGGLTKDVLLRLGGMYLQFIAVYGIVLIVIYLAAQRLAIYRFVKMKQHRESYFMQALDVIKQTRANRSDADGAGVFRSTGALLTKGLAKGVVLMVLFSPAYVIAYSVKTTVDTSSVLFMILLGIASNGVLIHMANGFFTFLVAESRKGYVQTAAVKNLHTSYEWNVSGGISLKALARITHGFRDHVFRHIFLNARFQFIPALKEHASFLITGLIIIEMALNIQGHLCYELLQKILYRQYDIAAAIIFGIFFTIKTTEIAIDVWEHKEKMKYGY